MTVWFFLNVYESWKKTRHEVALEATHQARLFADQISRALHSLESALGIVAGRIDSHGMGFFEGAEGKRLLDDMAHTVPLDSIFWVFRPDGVALSASIDISHTTVRISDRDYYKKISQDPGSDLVIGQPVTGKVSRASILPIGRGVRGKNGEIIAIVSTSLRLSSLNDAYGSFLNSGLNTIDLTRAEGGEKIFSIAGPTDTADGEQVAASDNRVYASERIQGYPLRSTAGVHLAPWRERWLRQVIFQGAWLLVDYILSLLLHWTVVRETRALGKNAVLLTEVHHRVKNNLAIIQSLLMMEANRAPPEARQGYDDSIARIEAMGLVHHLIYDHQRFEGIALDEYLRRLCAAVQGEHGRMHITIDASPIDVPLDTAIPLALITNEILANSMKHALLPGAQGRVAVTLSGHGKNLRLTITDNGPGLPQHVIKGQGRGLGLQIVQQLTRQLKGISWFENDNGARFILSVENPLVVG